MRGLNPRAWSKSHDAYCDFVTLDKTGAWVGWFKRCGIYLADSDIVVEFPTGLKDRHGKEIHIGDVVSEHQGDIIGEVVRNPSGEYRIAWFGIYGGDSSLYAHRSLCEFIGNIHENPGLIETKNERNEENPN